MAKTITDEEIKLSITINGNQAQNEINNLEKSTIKLKEKVSDLNFERKLVEKQLGKESSEYKKLTREINENGLQIEANEAKYKGLVSALKITELTVSQLNSKSRLLQATLRQLAPGTDDFKKYQSELNEVKDRLSELQGKAQQSKYSISSLADGFNKYAALGASVIAGLTGVVLSIQKIIDYNGKLSDTQADVMKTTGMTKNEVDELSKSFGLLETRTSRIDLLKIAEQGGRIGIVKSEIGGFVDVMNKANVALGDSFTGGVEEVANKLGKLKFLFQETKDMSVDQAYNSIGSAINDLGANGVASEANIAEFATRMGSLTDVLKPTIRETLALGAAFEESGIESEVSARAYNIFMKQASTESGKFAKVMRLSVKEVENMINTNPLDFMMKFAEGMKGMDATQTAKTLDYLGVNADGANKVIGAMGNNMSRFRELIDLSNNSFSLGTSLIKEYNIKNETLGATLEKISKKMTGLFSSDTFVKYLSGLVIWFSKFIGATEDADGSVAKWRSTLAFTAKVIAVIIGSMVSYSVGARIATLVSNGLTTSTTFFNIALKLQTFWLSLQKAALIAQVFVMNLFGMSTDRASASLARLNMVVKLNPFGAILAVITAVVAAYIAFSDSTVKAATAQETFAKQQRDLSISVAKSTADTKANISSLISLIQSENVSMDSKKKAYEELIKIAPIFNGFLKDEKFNIEGLLLVYAQYIKSLDAVEYARQFSKLNAANIKKQIEAEQKLFDTEKALNDKRIANRKLQKENEKYGAKSLELESTLNTEKAAVKVAANNLKIVRNNLVETNKFREQKISDLQKGIDREQKIVDAATDKTTAKYKVHLLKLNEYKTRMNSLVGANPDAPVTSDYTVPGDDGNAGQQATTKSLEEMNRERLDNERKFQEELLKLKRQAEDDAIALMQDGDQKELLIEAKRYQREIDDLERQKTHTEELAKIDENIAKAKKDGDTKYYNFLIQQKQVWADKNNQLDEQINQIKTNKLRIHQLKVDTIQEEAEKKRIENVQKEFEHQKLLRETAYNNQLALLGDNENAKADLKKAYDLEEYNQTKAHLQSLIKLLNDKLTLEFSSNIFDPKKKKEIQDQLDFLENAMSKLNAAQKGGNPEADKFGEAAKSAFGQTDILGFTPDQWIKTFDNLSTLEGKLSAVNMVVGGMQNLWKAYGDFQTASENRNLKQFEQVSDKKKLRLKRQLDTGYINQTQYDKQIKKIDDEYNQRKAEIEYKQAKREKTQAIFSAIINTAKSVTAVLYNPFLAALAATVGALQIATIAKQPLPAKGFEEGLYPDYVKREQDGKIFKSTGTSPMKSGLFTKPRILVGEGPGDSPEMVIDKKAYSQISPSVKNALIRELKGIKGFEQGYYNNDKMRIEVPAGIAPAVTNSNEELLKMALVVLSENTAVMKDLRDKGVEGKFYKGDYQSAKNIKDSISEYETFRNKNKR